MPQFASLTAPDFQEMPYWWNAAPPDRLVSQTLDRTYDVVVVGSGITGMRSAIELARAGLKVVVCDSHDAGYGASRRNAGYLGRTLKKQFIELERTHGHDYACEVYGELHAALATTFAFIEQEQIECFAHRCGRFIAATSRSHLDKLTSECESLRHALGINYQLVPQDRVREEMGSDLYFGGIVIPDLGSIHPGLYHKGLLGAAIKSGVTVSTRTEVLAVDRGTSGALTVKTSLGTVTAANVVITTNGYTPRRLQWYARRVIPFTGYMAATEELSPEVLASVIPKRRTIIDSNFNVDFFRPAPDSSRLLFGGSTGSPLSDTNAIVMRMQSILTRVFPQLNGVRLSSVWSGQCAATFDMMPHFGHRDGLWYGMGYNFAGVPMGTYFGLKIARGILGDPSSKSVFADAPFRTVPFYTGKPWFVPLAMRVFEWRDRRIARGY